MPRNSRNKSSTGIYHVMLRGIDKRKIFLDNEDRYFFIEKMIEAKEKGGFDLYAYCLMDNHVHLLIKESEELGTSVKRITVGYVGWHNNKYGRVGHLFQNRYASEVVEKDGYLLTVLRYIHQNPIKAGIVKDIEEYLWSSYKEYINYYSNKDYKIKADMISGYFNCQKAFEDYMRQENTDKCIEYNENNKLTEVELKELMLEKVDINKLKTLSKKERNSIIKTIYTETEVSIRQLSKVLGLGKAIIESALRQDD